MSRPAEGRLDPVLDPDEEVGVAVQLRHVRPARLLLQRVLDLLTEGVSHQPGPARTGVGVVLEAELLVELLQRSVLSLKYTATWYSTWTRSRDGAFTESAVGLPSAAVFEMM